MNMAHTVTLAELRDWPPTCTVTAAAKVLGVSRATAYESIRLGTFPARTIRVNRRMLVLTSSLIAALDAGTPVA